ncbi:hypothetical protein NLG97_g7221 [Lecanicillium saksenae]|uniref:Uncharacterized protein n=1 Tax=Lecanicillium saksenae TaxID=468837 RepID=A0ACC1QQE8_9HYPO|nr:hypothetical protein NLG97_g7221 [Lecanicillium saksenae]
MCPKLQFEIEFHSGERFRFCWVENLSPASVRNLRIVFAMQFAVRFAQSPSWERLSFRPSSRSDREPVNPLTPCTETTPQSSLPTKEIHSYDVIGRGWSGIVHLAIDLHDGREYAVKSMQMVRSFDDEATFLAAVWQFKEEVETLAFLNHPNIAKLEHHQGWSLKRSVQIFMTLYDGNAKELVVNRRCCAPISTARREHLRNFLVHCLGALRYLHKRDLVHRDVKLANILFKREFDRGNSGISFYLSDFGLTTACGRGWGPAGDNFYTAPELFDTERMVPAGPASDIYSFGIAILEFLGVVCPKEYTGADDLWCTKLYSKSSLDEYKDAPLHGSSHHGFSRIQSLRSRGLLRNATLEAMLDPIPENRPSAGKALFDLAMHYGFTVPRGWLSQSNLSPGWGSAHFQV